MSNVRTIQYPTVALFAAPKTVVIFCTTVLVALSFLLLLSTPAHSSNRVELIMFEQHACEWCEAWNEDIGVAYPKTWEGKAAPLRRVDIYDETPEDLSNIRVPRFTPVFVLMVNGQESSRLRGYPGPEFFWPLLDEMLEKAGISEPSGN